MRKNEKDSSFPGIFIDRTYECHDDVRRRIDEWFYFSFINLWNYYLLIIFIIMLRKYVHTIRIYGTRSLANIFSFQIILYVISIYGMHSLGFFSVAKWFLVIVARIINADVSCFFFHDMCTECTLFPSIQILWHFLIELPNNIGLLTCLRLSQTNREMT